MATDLFNRYLWLVDTIRTYGRISRCDIDALWQRSELSNGMPMPRRTFANYRAAAESIFNISIKCDSSTYEYYIEDDPANKSVNDWLLNTAATHQLLSQSHDVADKIVVDDVPSAQKFLAPVIDALRENKRICFDYMPYYRLRPTIGIVFEPLLLKLFRHRWYVIGRHLAQRRIKTYALDRISSLHLLPDTFTPDPNFNAKTYFEGAFGIVVDSGHIYKIIIRTSPQQAKYFRALPLHSSQQEYIHDDYSDFHLRLRITNDLIQELLSYGSRIEILAPPLLRRAVANELSQALDLYVSDFDVISNESH